MFEPRNVRLEKARKETLNTAPRRDGSGGIGFRKLLLILLIFALIAVAVFVFYETDDPDFYYFRGSVYAVSYTHLDRASRHRGADDQ